ncbi:MAG: ferredoxin:thioredoxin reductase [Candidatus Nanohalarchaeota archaeon]|nr:MAG: ferredoxin:thioredoxin reductase [Candidatus Nanohaloarchaeota archaeon]
MKKPKNTLKNLKSMQKKNGFRLNPNRKIIEYLIKGLIKNAEEFGKKYCPCRRIHNDRVICPCIHHKKEIKEQGHCHCFLFVSKEFSD